MEIINPFLNFYLNVLCLFPSEVSYKKIEAEAPESRRLQKVLKDFMEFFQNELVFLLLCWLQDIQDFLQKRKNSLANMQVSWQQI